MSWFSVHIIIGMHEMGGQTISVEEQVYLIEGTSITEVSGKARAIGLQISGLDDKLTTKDGVPITRLYGGIRQIVATQNMHGATTAQPTDGCELTYSEFSVSSLEEFSKLTNGDDVVVTLFGVPAGTIRI